MLQVLPTIRGAQLVSFIDGSSPASPEEIVGKDNTKVLNLAYST
jgi:hypothetical protein